MTSSETIFDWRTHRGGISVGKIDTRYLVDRQLELTRKINGTFFNLREPSFYDAK